MSTSSTSRRRVQRYGLAGIGSAVLFVGIASPAAAATDVVIPLEPTEVALSAAPVENFGLMDPAADPNAMPVDTLVQVQFSGTLVVDLPAELVTTDVEAELVFDDNDDGIPEATYSSEYAPANPRYLTVTGQGTGSITVTLPTDDPAVLDEAELLLQPFTTTLGPEFTFYDPVYYELEFDAAAPAVQTVEPALVAYSTLPCDLSTWTSCPFPTPVTAGSTVGLDLTAGSVLRDFGLTDLAGLEASLSPADPDGFPTGEGVSLDVQVSGSTASFVLPAGTAPGLYSLLLVQQAPSGRVSVIEVELTVVAPDAAPAPAAPTAAAPTTQAVAGNVGLRSNTGVTAPAEESDAGVLAGGLGLLALAGAGGVAVARTRRPAATGTGEA